MPVQNEEEVRNILDDHGDMASERMPWESIWREIDERVDPEAEGGFVKRASGGERGLNNFDATATEGLDRWTAAMGGLTTPAGSRWHGLTIADYDLARDQSVKEWCAHAVDQLFACRYNPQAGFKTANAQDLRQIGKYGTSGIWIDDDPGRRLLYSTPHLSELYIGTDAVGLVNKVHRRFRKSARELAGEYGEEALSPRMQECLTADNSRRRNEHFEVLQLVAPNDRWEPGNPGPAGKRFKSVHVAIDEKFVMRRGGYRTMPIPVSRAVTSAGVKYGRSPAMKVLGLVRVVNEIAKTILKNAHKKVDPALAFYSDGMMSRVVTRPGGLNPGLVDSEGRLLVSAMPGGGDLNFGVEYLTLQQQPIKDAFLEQLFQILLDPSDRMTATQVLEMIQKQGVLVAPFAGGHETEKLSPMILRELDILMHARVIRPLPPVLIEAGIGLPQIVYENPLSKMARAEEAAGFTRWLEIATQMATFDPSVFDHVNTDKAMNGVAHVLSVRPDWMNSPEEVAAKRGERQAREQQMAEIQSLQPASVAALNLAKANDIGEAA